MPKVRVNKRFVVVFVGSIGLWVQSITMIWVGFWVGPTDNTASVSQRYKYTHRQIQLQLQATTALAQTNAGVDAKQLEAMMIMITIMMTLRLILLTAPFAVLDLLSGIV